MLEKIGSSDEVSSGFVAPGSYKPFCIFLHSRFYSIMLCSQYFD